MKKYLTICTVFLFTQFATAQTFELDIEKDTAYCDQVFKLEYARAFIINTFVEPITLDIVRRQLPDVRNWRTGMCVGEVCYTPDVDSVRVTLQPSEELLLRSSFSMIGIVNDTMEVIYDITNVERTQDKEAFFTYGVDISSKLTSTETALSTAAIKVYPNPTNDLINIETDQAVQYITVYSTDGRHIISTRHIAQVNLHNQPSGQYIIHIQTANGSITRKVTKN